MRRRLLLGVAVFALIVPHIRTDEPTRRAQEELRKRNLYFGDVDGKMKPELVDALKHYQVRKGFDVTGQLDEATANSLDIPLANSAAGVQSWPDVPVLKSDAARSLPQAKQSALQTNSSVNSEPSPTPPAMTPPAATTSSLSSEEVTHLVQNYLRDAETDDVDLQIRYYAYPVEYFDHGRVDRQFVVRDTHNYVKRWPRRKYTLLEPVTVQPAGPDGATQLEFTIAFEVRNKNHAVRGKTRNFWTLQPQARNLRIVALKEQRLHE
jgi:hypothetical protein